MYKHGFSLNGKVHPIYKIWVSMKQRCNNPRDRAFKDYGGRGISVCEEWINNADAFVSWAIAYGWEKGLSIDRINNDGNYSPDNCRFVTRQFSACNQRLLRKNNTSGYRGVTWRELPRKWEARISVDGKNKHLGFFDSPKLAALRYDVEAFLLNDGRPMNFIDSLAIQ